VNSQIRTNDPVFSRDGGHQVFSSERQAFKSLEEIFEGYTPEKREEIIKAFEADKITNDFIKTLYSRYGLDSALFKGLLLDYVHSHTAKIIQTI
jgi:hypothetical protein